MKRKPTTALSSSRRAPKFIHKPTSINTYSIRTTTDRQNRCLEVNNNPLQFPYYKSACTLLLQCTVYLIVPTAHSSDTYNTSSAETRLLLLAPLLVCVPPTELPSTQQKHMLASPTHGAISPQNTPRTMNGNYAAHVCCVVVCTPPINVGKTSCTPSTHTTTPFKQLFNVPIAVRRRYKAANIDTLCVSYKAEYALLLYVLLRRTRRPRQKGKDVPPIPTNHNTPPK